MQNQTRVSSIKKMLNNNTSQQPLQLIYPSIQNLSQIIENIGETKGFVVQHHGPFTFVSYKVVSSESFPIIPISETNGVLSFDLSDEKEVVRRLMRREIRGLVFDRVSQKLVARSMPKFFNIDEKEETSVKIVDKMIRQLKKSSGKEKPFVLLEKLDGSLCTPCIEYLENGNDDKLIPFRVRFRTKLDYQNDHSQSIEEFVYQLERNIEQEKEIVKKEGTGGEDEEEEDDVSDEFKRQYHDLRKKTHEERLPMFHCSHHELCHDEFVTRFENESMEEQTNRLIPNVKSRNLIRFCVEFMNKGFTPLFEYFSPDHRVVVNYGSPFVSLLAIRNTVSGVFVPYEEMKSICDTYGIQCVKSCENVEITKNTDIKSIKKAIEEEKGHEGYVLVLDNGFMFKIKSDWYLNIHKTNEMLITESMREGRIWYLIFDNTLDDVLPHIHSMDHKKKLEQFNDKVIFNLEQTVEYMFQTMKLIESQVTETSNFIKVAKEKESHSFFYGTLLKTWSSIDKKLKAREITPEEVESETRAILLDSLLYYLKPLVKKIETVRDVITTYVNNQHNFESFKECRYTSQQQAILDLTLFNNNNL